MSQPARRRGPAPPPRRRARCRRPRPRRPGASARSSAGAAREGTGGPTCRTTMPAVEPRRGEQQSGDELAGGRGVDDDLAAGHLAGALHGQRQPAAGRRRRCGRRGRAAPRPAGRAGRTRALRVAVEGDLPSASPASGGTNRMTVPAGPTSTWAGPRSGCGPDQPALVVLGGDVGAQRPQPAGHQLGVAGAQRVAQRRGAVGERAEHQGPGGQRLGAGQPQRRRDRVGRGRRGPGCGGRVAVRFATVTFCRVAGCGRSSAGRSRLAGRRAAGDGAGRGRDASVCRMCGRYATTRSAADLSALFEAYDETGGPARRRLQRRADRSGADACRGCARARAGRRCSRWPAWGLLPPWAKDVAGAARMINARAETVATSRAYATAFARRRCLVPADGWYEWVRGGRRQAGVLHDAARRLGARLRRPVVGLARRRRAAADLQRASPRPRSVTWPWCTTGCRCCCPASAGTTGWPAAASRGDCWPRRPRSGWARWRSVRSDKAVGDVRNNGPDLIAAVPAPPLRALPEDRRRRHCSDRGTAYCARRFGTVRDGKSQRLSQASL